MSAMIDRRVVLPAPFGPMIATTSPFDAVSETPRSATRSPNRFSISRASSSTPLATEVFIALEPEAERRDQLDRAFDVAQLHGLDRRVHVAQWHRDEAAWHSRARHVDGV